MGWHCPAGAGHCWAALGGVPKPLTMVCADAHLLCGAPGRGACSWLGPEGCPNGAAFLPGGLLAPSRVWVPALLLGGLQGRITMAREAHSYPMSLESVFPMPGSSAVSGHCWGVPSLFLL